MSNKSGNQRRTFQEEVKTDQKDRQNQKWKKIQGFSSNSKTTTPQRKISELESSNLYTSVATAYDSKFQQKKEILGQPSQTQFKSPQVNRSKLGLQKSNDLRVNQYKQEAKTFSFEIVAQAEPQLYKNANSNRKLEFNNEKQCYSQSFLQSTDEQNLSMKQEKGEMGWKEGRSQKIYQKKVKQIFKNRAEQKRKYNIQEKIKQKRYRNQRRNKLMEQKKCRQDLQQIKGNGMSEDLDSKIRSKLFFEKQSNNQDLQNMITPMSYKLQRILAQPYSQYKNLQDQVDLQFLFAKYCPSAPLNTNQFLSLSYEQSMKLNVNPSNMALPGFSGSLAWEEINYEENSNKNNDDSFENLENYHSFSLQRDNAQKLVDDYDEVEQSGKKKGIENELLSCCKLKHKCEHFLGSSSYSFEALQTLSSLSLSSKSLNFAPLEQIGATMEGFMMPEMFEDLTLSETDLVTQISVSSNDEVNGKQNEDCQASEIKNHAHEADLSPLSKNQNYSLLANIQGSNSDNYKNLTSNNDQSEKQYYQLESTHKYQSSAESTWQDQEICHQIKLELELESSKYLIEQLERELILKNALIEKMSSPYQPTTIPLTSEFIQHQQMQCFLFQTTQSNN